MRIPAEVLMTDDESESLSVSWGGKDDDVMGDGHVISGAQAQPRWAIDGETFIF